MNPIVLTREQCREVDRRAAEEYGIPSIVLMENAGRGCVDVMERLGIGGPVTIVCGKGNNAGDGFVIARHLTIRGHECRVLLLGAAEDLRGDAATNFAILQKCGVPIHVVAGLPGVVAGLLTEPSPRPQVSSAKLEETFGHHRAGSGDRRTTTWTHDSGTAWIVDALFGTGARGDPRPPFDAAINWINRQPANASRAVPGPGNQPHKTRILAVDLPSGLDCDTGQPATHTVRADHTCTFAAMKIGFANPAAKPYTGALHICDIGVLPRLIAEVCNQSV